MSGDNPINDAVDPGEELESPEDTAPMDISESTADSEPGRISSKEIFSSDECDTDAPKGDDDSAHPSANAPEVAETAPEESDSLQEDAETLQEEPDSLQEDAETLQEEQRDEDDSPANDDNDDDDDDDDDDGDGDDNVLSLENNEDDTPDEILLSRIESLVFIYPEPITVRRLAKHLSLTGKRVRQLLDMLKAHYADRGINLSEIGGGFQFHTNPHNADVVRTLTKSKPLRMSRPALETLAIVAYKQPCTRAEVEDVRRVDCGGTLKFLFEKELVRVLGRKEEPGRPIIYGTSSKFLELFNLKSLSDLPSLHEYTELWDEHRELVDDDADGESGDKAGPKKVASESLEENRQQEIPVDEHLTDSSKSASDAGAEAPADGEDEETSPAADDIDDNGDDDDDDDLGNRADGDDAGEGDTDDDDDDHDHDHGSDSDDDDGDDDGDDTDEEDEYADDDASDSLTTDVGDVADISDISERTDDQEDEDEVEQ
ncbi:MAG: SMC-Scp complex subunit ScpB [Deltaproteobacteria bacterium]|nr:SMC-Scp complex subunit ScpB [Deltaproteobacteria bacterium]